MKRSEMVDLLREEVGRFLPVGTVRDLLERMDACHTWDPEVEPAPEEALPERIFFKVHNIPKAGPMPLLCSDEEATYSEMLSDEGYAEAARRWNEWPELRALVAQHIMAGGGPEACSDLCQSLFAILDGKPEGGQP